MNRSLLIIVIIIGLFGFNRVMAQSKAQKLFNNQEYASAISAYEKELKKSKDKNERAGIESRIGICYHYINQPAEASNWLKKSISHGHQDTESYYIYGLSLQKQEKYTEALDAFKQVMNADPGFNNIQLHIQSCEYALAHNQPNTHIALRSSKINTEGSEYGISTGSNKEVFFSRASHKGKIDPRTGLGYSEVFVTRLEGNELTKPKKEKAFMKAYYNTGIFAYDSITNYMYMTICDPKGKCGIYRSKYNRKKWEKPEPFFLNDNYDMAHPALAKNGTRLYFVSNAPGGFGKTDIWYSDKYNDTQWGEPVNAGRNINTAEREEFPFIEKDSILYFASNGHPGFGGLDIFRGTIQGDEIVNIENIGRPFNSGADDFNLITMGDKGLLVSSRNVKNNDDIYIFNKKDLPSPPPAEPKKEIKEEPVEEPVEAAPEPVKPPVVAQKPATNTIALIYFDFNRFVPQRTYRQLYDQIVSQMKSYPNAIFEIAGYADTRGGTSFNIELSDKRAEYIAKRLTDRGIKKDNLVIKGYGFNHPAVPNAKSEEDYQKNRRVEIRILQLNH